VALHSPGKPQQNAFIESFIGRLRDELLNETLFTSLAHVRESSDDLEERLQSREAAQRNRQSRAIDPCRSAPGTQRVGALRYTQGFAPRPVAPPSRQGSNQSGL
jgi:putative transposase